MRRVLAFGVLLMAAALPRAASAQEVTVRVTIEHSQWFNCDDGPFGGPPDIYFAVTIDGNRLETRDNQISVNIGPGFTVNQEFSQRVDISRGTIPIVIEQWDADSGATGSDDQCQISATGNELDLLLDLTACTVSGEVSGVCDVTLESPSFESLEFSIRVEEPASAPGLNVRCIHDPIWPQPGDTVRITADSLDGNLGQRLADRVEIWVDNQTNPSVNAPGFNSAFTAGPYTGEKLTYGCRIVDDGLVAWTGWRTVAVGTSPLTEDYGGRIPILYTGPRSSRLDMVFYADRDSYTSSNDPQFLTDVRNAIVNSYYTEDVFLVNQDRMNYWLAEDTGRADTGCEIEAPRKSWEDAGIILHTDNLRDCAKNGVFSSEPNSFRTILHETGHRPFGLADEYCCDGGYFQTNPFPDLYSPVAPIFSLVTCAEDAVNVGRTEADCRSFVEDVPWWFDNTWFTSDPASDDLMVDRGRRRALDNRRIFWLFDVCRGSGC
ncbi:MAG TPA: hypothetical protein VF789_06680 [Thermoanaerobaculia bacterium]